MGHWQLWPERVNLEGSVTEDEIRALVADPALEVVQCTSPLHPRSWDLLNEQLFTRRPDVELRLYGFHGTVCDLSFASRMTNVRRFSADCLMEATGLEHLADMRALESLGVGIYHLEGFEFLDRVSPSLKRLFLGQTKSRKPSLSPLGRFRELQTVYLDGQQKQIEVLSQLTRLEGVTLRSVSTPDLGYLRPLRRMWSLDLKLGGIRDLYAIEGMEGIKYLELWQIRGLSDICVISSLTGLQFLALQSLRQVTALPPLDRLSRLRRVYLENMVGLQDLSSLEHAPALEAFAHIGARNMQPEAFAPLLRNPSLREATVGFGSDRRNAHFAALAAERGIVAHDFRAFEFV